MKYCNNWSEFREGWKEHLKSCVCKCAHAHTQKRKKIEKKKDFFKGHMHMYFLEKVVIFISGLPQEDLESREVQ